MQESLGSFGSSVPGGSQDPIQAAIQARQSGSAPVPALNQTLTGSPEGSTNAPLSGITPSAQGTQDKPQVQNAEVEIILKALTQRLGTISKLENPPAPGGGGSNG